MRKTKIICTLGPNVDNYDVFLELGKSMDVSRFNFSHGDYEEHKKRLENLKKVRKELNREIPALLDTKGPEIRTGNLKDGKKVFLKEGNKIILTTNEEVGDENRIYINYESLVNDVKIGSKILIDDGLIELEVLDIKEKEINCKILSGGELGEKKGVNIPSIKINLPDLTEKDIKDIEFGIKEDFDIIAASFVRNANCIKIMIARGDLGVEVNPTELPWLQKEIIKKCNAKGKIVVTATQMLDSMIRNIRPTRAEVTDVANAIYDGTDVIMLSGETANGKYPIEAIKMMDEICRASEKNVDYTDRRERLFQNKVLHTITNTMCREVSYTADILNAKAIVAPTNSGNTARVLSKFKPEVPIFALSNDEKIVRKMMIYFGVIPIYMEEKPKETDEMLDRSIKLLKEKNHLSINDLIVVTFGVNQMNQKTHTNAMRVQVVL